jgi:hypothetical protein
VLLVIVGPMYPFARVTTCLGIRQASGAKVVAWFTEQTPDPSLPRPVQRQGARALAAIDRSAARTGARVPALDALTDRFQRRAVRLKLTGHLAWLHRRGQLQHLAVLAPSRAYFEGRLGIPASCVPFGTTLSWRGPGPETRHRRALPRQRGGRPPAAGSDQSALVCRPRHPLRGDGRRQPGPASLRGRPHRAAQPLEHPGERPAPTLGRPVFRMLLAAPCGAMLLEPTVDEAPFRAGEHFVASALDEMPAMVGGTWRTTGRVRPSSQRRARRSSAGCRSWR